MYNRVIIKISGEGLSGNSSEHFHDKTIVRIVKEVNELVKKGVQVALVVGGGNFWRGRDAKAEMDKVSAHQIGMLATIMNGLYVADAFRVAAENSKEGKVGAKCVVMTPFEAGNFTTRYSKDVAIECMKNGIVPIFAGGTGHPFFSTDSIVAIRACELKVDAVLYGKSVKCVYDSDPKKNKKAKKYKTVSYETVLADQLEVADISAISLTSKENIPSVVFALSKSGAIIDAATSDEALFAIGGTKIDNKIVNELYPDKKN